MTWKRTILIPILCLCLSAAAQQRNYPQGYFRHPMNIPMQLVANFGEIRTNHWHMGLDIRTQQRENLPVYAAAEGYVARVVVEPGGFGQALYINHPNGLTTLYAHLNAFYPALAQYVRDQQYAQESWKVDLELPAGLFPVKQGDYIALSGNTGGSQGPHVHFEIRNTETDNCLNPLLFGFPVPDAVPPTLSRLVLYDRNRSMYAQTPQSLPLRGGGSSYSLLSQTIRVGTDKVSFAIGATDRFTGSSNPNGIYSARVLVDEELQSEFLLDDIDYDETRYMNAQIDYRWKASGGPAVQQLSPMPGDTSDIYTPTPSRGVVQLTDTALHAVRIEVRDAAQNLSTIRFHLRYDPELRRPVPAPAQQAFYPGEVNVYESAGFELYTSELTPYDTVAVTHREGPLAPGAVSPLHTFLSAAIPVHDTVTVRIRPTGPVEPGDRVVIKSVAGSRTVVQRALPARGWLTARFRQFGTYQAFLDNEPPRINAPGTGDTIDLRRSTRLVFTPQDNFNTIRSFRAELDGRYLVCSNDKGRTWIYRFDERFPPGVHRLSVAVEDEAGNVTRREWMVRR
ncbi:MAG TPA: M23 family metallopeptidase [Chitinophagaceae bacterium]|nr:M23 family metallopeptidase [Chitinophagaceae bacterium]